MCKDPKGVRFSGAFFNADGTDLTWDMFIEKIESVGLEIPGETLTKERFFGETTTKEGTI